MDRLVISRLHARYRLAAPLVLERDRLDRIFRDLARTGIGEALTSSSLAADEEICVRSVRAPVTVRLDATDHGLSVAWGAAVVRALEATIEQGGPGVVRYPSRSHGLVDLAMSVAVDDLERAWAWRRLGIWQVPDTASPTEVAAATVRALAGQPHTIIPALAALGAAGRAAAFLGRIGGDGILALAAAAVVAAAVPETRPTVGLLAEPGADGDLERAARATAASRILARSPLAGVARALGPDLDDRPRRALAVLIVLEQDPAIGQGPGRAARLVESIAERIGPQPAARRKELRGGRAIGARPIQDPQVGPERTHRVTPQAGRAEAHDDPAGASIVPPRIAGHTSAAGLLYLLPIVAHLGLPAELASAAAFADRPVRWWLHLVAQAIARIDPTDPAALTFVGLGPGSLPPSHDEPAASQEEGRRAARLATRIALTAARRLDRRDESPRRLLASICQRPGDVIADPGWIEIRMPMSAVDLGIRRAGLDLDPGFVPWLGVVVRFRYG